MEETGERPGHYFLPSHRVRTRIRVSPLPSSESVDQGLGSAGDSQRRLIDLRSGADVATGITDAGFDSKSSLLVTANSNLHGFDLDGRKQWDAPLAADDHLSAVGGGIIAIEDESSAKSTSGGTRGEITGEFEMRSVNDGRTLNPVDANLGVPHHIAETGARLVGDPSKPLLVTPGH